MDSEIDIQSAIFIQKTALDEIQKEYFEIKNMISQVQSEIEQMDFEID